MFHKLSIAAITLTALLILGQRIYAVEPSRSKLAKTTLPVLGSINVKTNAQPITVTGEVVDSWCYASHVMGEGRGAKHQKCALSCITGGVAPGILDDQGNLYIAAKHTGYQGCRSLLMPYVAKRVTVKGWVARRGGCQVLKVTSVKSAP